MRKQLIRSTCGYLAIASLSAFLAGAPAVLAAQPAFPPGAEISSWADNGANGRYLLQIEDGVLPAEGETLTGEVISDTDCAPDAEDINHCRNEIRFADGAVLTGIDNHRMSVNRCLRPGETVAVSKLTEGWAVVLIEGAEAAQ